MFFNPTFGFASYLVGGADADLLIDNTLIDIKTTRDPRFTRSFFNQLMGYVILHEIGKNYQQNACKIMPKKHADQLLNESENVFLNTKIKKIGIYFSRSGKLRTIDLKDIIPDGKLNFELLKWFENEAHSVYRPMITETVKIKKLFKWDFPLIK